MKEYNKAEYAEQRKEAFAKGFLELLMQKPYHKIVVRDLCEHWKISRKTFYRYFSNKEDALNSLVDYVLMNIVVYHPPAESNTGNPVYDEALRYFCYWSENRHILRMFLENSLIEALFFRSAANMLSEMELFQKNLRHLPPNAQKSIVAYFAGGVISMLLCWIQYGFLDTPEQMAERLVYLVGYTDGLLDR